MNRPGLKKLLEDVKAGKIDIIIVYKLDRLSRSICDFAELSKVFDKHGTSFVSVTQEINTTTSSGRMMLNILVTFAQYEREVIAERIRDKMSASRKKGKWVGGSVPLGYKVVDKHLHINEEEVEIVKRIFTRFLEIGSPRQIAFELEESGVARRDGRPWNVSHIYRILQNHTYIGKVNYKGEIYEGEHEAIIDYMESFIKTFKKECLNHFVLTSEAQLRYVVKEFLEYYNHERPHSALDGRMIKP